VVCAGSAGVFRFELNHFDQVAEHLQAGAARRGGKIAREGYNSVGYRHAVGSLMGYRLLG
jgi:hypothetical protein